MIDLTSFYSNDPFNSIYNLQGFKNVFLSTDIDWAPDFVVEDVLSLVESYGFPITAFCTHRSSLMSRLGRNVEIGIHPDNTRVYEGSIFEDKIKNLMDIFPEAKGVRCHRNFFGQNIAELSRKHGLVYDASVLLWQQPFCSIHIDQYGLNRVPYFWEDGIHCDTSTAFKLDTIRFNVPGLKVFNIHPILIYLNAPNDDFRRNVVKGYSDLTKATYKDLSSRRFQGYGIRSFLIDIFNEFNKNKVQVKNLGALFE